MEHIERKEQEIENKKQELENKKQEISKLWTSKCKNFKEFQDYLRKKQKSITCRYGQAINFRKSKLNKGCRK